ncbi:dipeptidase PepV [Margalitia sp. FSL K6-0131]|uniref:dipeptidase PepV n=1 Tax=Margalitia sp. FSL K6-0131 TaxID=2954604 RepID=UPI0030F91E1B
MVNWYQEVQDRKEKLVEDLFGLLQIESVKDLSTKTEVRPMGEEIGKALDYMLQLSAEAGFKTKNLAGYAGYAEHGEHLSDDYVGILCHVDVVPATGNWTSPPFEPTIRDGKIFARGSIDDKGPTMAAYYGLKIVKELGLPMKRNVRIIFGTDEESGMSCMRHYQEVEKLPVIGFAPDADFPIINAEKGQMSIKITLNKTKNEKQYNLNLVSFSAGSRINMVPEQATAVLYGDNSEVLEKFEEYCQENQYHYSMEVLTNTVKLTLFGISAHAMEPFAGRNAGTALGEFLNQFKLQSEVQPFVSLLSQLHNDYYGEKFGITFSDDVTGPLTVNPGIIQYDQEGKGSIFLNMRCPVTLDFAQTKERIVNAVEEKGFSVAECRESAPHFVDSNHPMIKALQKVYQEETNQEPTLLSTGGATYARFMEKGVAFGACFPGKEYRAHQQDEYIEVEDLLKATAIYARAIYELANLDS